jgi:hypothetical protein
MATLPQTARRRVFGDAATDARSDLPGIARHLIAARGIMSEVGPRFSGTLRAIAMMG